MELYFPALRSQTQQSHPLRPLEEGSFAREAIPWLRTVLSPETPSVREAAEFIPAKSSIVLSQAIRRTREEVELILPSLPTASSLGTQLRRELKAAGFMAAPP